MLRYIHFIYYEFKFRLKQYNVMYNKLSPIKNPQTKIYVPINIYKYLHYVFNSSYTLIFITNTSLFSLIKGDNLSKPPCVSRMLVVIPEGYLVIT